MTQSSIASRIVGAVTLGSALVATMAPLAQAQEYQYSAQLVQRYNSGCSNQLIKKGYSSSQASSLCACSLKQMQMQHSQSSAIVLLTSAQLNPIKDSRFGLPTNLSKFFTPCLG